jgi:hypothetical protein
MSRNVKSASHHGAFSQSKCVCNAAVSIIVSLFARVREKDTKKSIGQESALIVPPPKPPPRPADHYSSPSQARGHERMHVSRTKKNTPLMLRPATICAPHKEERGRSTSSHAQNQATAGNRLTARGHRILNLNLHSCPASRTQRPAFRTAWA